MELNRVYLNDCISGMEEIESNSIDMILCDLPYGTTQLKWDKVIPFDKLWKQYERVIKENGAIVLTGSQPFTTDLINSNRKLFRYEIIWEKTMKSGFLDANRRPLKSHENILVFYKKQPIYNPIKKPATKKAGTVKKNTHNRSNHYGNIQGSLYEDNGERFPTTVIKISNWNGALFGCTTSAVKHPTQKPVELFEYLIKTYTNQGGIVLDNCMGSGTTAIACINQHRHFIGFERDEKYFNQSIKRIEEHIKSFCINN